MRRAITVAIAVVTLAGPSFAGSPAPPPASPGDAITVPPTTSEDLVQILRLGEFTARFEETSLQEIADKLGGGIIGHAGDASKSLRWLCYSVPGQLLWLISTPMGGADARLMQVAAESVSTFDPRVDTCGSVPKALQPISLEFGWIGTSETELHQKLGQPSGFRGEQQLFFFRGKVSGAYRAPGEETSSIVDYEVIAYVEAKIENGSVSALRASRVTSY